MSELQPNQIALRIKVIMSANRALLGAITKNLRAITVDYNPQLLTLRAYFDTGATEDDKELIDVALTEMIADLSDEIKEFKYEPVDLPAPARLTVLKDWVYLREEKSPE